MDKTPAQAAAQADDLITQELARQDAMWGETNERADITDGELMSAATAQLMALGARRAGLINAFNLENPFYPENWSGFRSYGSDVANLVVAAAYLRQEVKRLILEGADTTRTPRTVPYEGDNQPNQIEN